MEPNKSTFVFNLAWYETLKDYAPEVRLEVYEAAMMFAASGTTPELKPLAKMAFAFIKKEIEYNTGRYQSMLDKRRAAGKSRWSKGDDEMLPQPAADSATETPPVPEPAPAPDPLPAILSDYKDFDALQAELLDDSTFWEASAMAFKTPVATLKSLLPTFVSERTALGQPGALFSDFRRHFYSWSRIAIAKQLRDNDTKPQDKRPKRRGADSTARSAEDYSDSI